MAKEYIERGDAYDAVMGQFCASSDETEAALNGAIEEIRKIPAADVVPVVHARWIEKGGVWECPNCKAAYKARLLYIKPNYCPNCGARMEVQDG